MQRDDTVKNVDADLPSAHYFLTPSDVQKFQKGRAKLEILRDINWKGNFQMAGPYQQESASAISYDLFSEAPESEGGEVVFAIFLDDKFAKFIKWFPAETIQVPYRGTTRTYPKPIKIGDVEWLARAVESKAVDISELEKEYRARPSVPDQVDPGLTIAYLLLRTLGKAPGPDGIADYERNAKLRDKFNAARLDIGMSEPEVNAVFKATPLKTGQVEAGTVKVYGSIEAPGGSIVISYSNILVLFKDGKASAIYAIDGGPEWVARAKERFVDLPKW